MTRSERSSSILFVRASSAAKRAASASSAARRSVSSKSEGLGPSSGIGGIPFGTRTIFSGGVGVSSGVGGVTSSTSGVGGKSLGISSEFCGSKFSWSLMMPPLPVYEVLHQFQRADSVLGQDHYASGLSDLRVYPTTQGLDLYSSS